MRLDRFELEDEPRHALCESVMQFARHTLAFVLQRQRLDPSGIRSKLSICAFEPLCQLKFELRALKGKKMHPARMQMDWMRYWTMRAPNERSVKAPQFELSTYNGAC